MNPRFKKIVGIGTLTLIVLLGVFIVVRVYQLKNQRHFSWRKYVGTHRRHPVSAADIVYIAPWMTFDYINKVFGLPEAYLEQTVQIQDSKYPFITIQRYAKNSNINTSVLIESIRGSIKQYLASSTPQ